MATARSSGTNRDCAWTSRVRAPTTGRASRFGRATAAATRSGDDSLQPAADLLAPMCIVPDPVLPTSLADSLLPARRLESGRTRAKEAQAHGEAPAGSYRVLASVRGAVPDGGRQVD